MRSLALTASIFDLSSRFKMGWLFVIIMLLKGLGCEGYKMDGLGIENRLALV